MYNYNLFFKILSNAVLDNFSELKVTSVKVDYKQTLKILGKGKLVLEHCIKNKILILKVLI